LHLHRTPRYGLNGPSQWFRAPRCACGGPAKARVAASAKNTAPRLSMRALTGQRCAGVKRYANVAALRRAAPAVHQRHRAARSLLALFFATARVPLRARRKGLDVPYQYYSRTSSVSALSLLACLELVDSTYLDELHSTVLPGRGTVGGGRCIPKTRERGARRIWRVASCPVTSGAAAGGWMAWRSAAATACALATDAAKQRA